MKCPPLSEWIILAGIGIAVLGGFGAPMSAPATWIGLALFVLVTMALMELFRPSRKRKLKGPPHPISKAGNMFALIGLVFVVLSFMLDAGLGLFTAGTFFVLAVICWVFGSALRSA